MQRQLDDGVSLAPNRRDFLKASVAVPAAGAAIWAGTGRADFPPVRAGIVGTGNEGCVAMIDQSPPDYLQYVAYHDIRPSQIERGRKFFRRLYGEKAGSDPNEVAGGQVTFHDTWEKMLADPNVEAIVIATPLWTHAKFAIDALLAGKHVFCEKLMAHNITDAKAMVRAGDQAQQQFGGVFGVGHQRHYSQLYADAVRTVESGSLGTIKHIRAFWHRNNTHTYIDEKTGELRVKDSWRPDVPEADRSLDPTKYGYKSLEELVRWRLYDRTGGGLMAELGSHQLDACSIFLGHEHPVAVSGVGGKYYYEDDRDCDDHVYCMFEFPEGRVVTYSSINTNAMEGYGEQVMGTRGTLMVLHERDVWQFDESDPLAAKRIEKTTVETSEGSKDESSMYSAASLGLPQEAKGGSSGPVSRGYKEELEHFAYCVRNRAPENQPRCNGRVALADAVMALSANAAMRKGTRLVFQDEWYDPSSEAVPDDVPQDLSLAKRV